MTAETLTARQAADAIVPFGHGLAGTVKAAFGTYAVAANVEDGDIFEMCKLPKNSLVLGGVFYAGDLDTGTEAIDLDVGYTANGGGSDTLTTSDGTTWTNTASTASATGFVNGGVLTGDAITDLLAAGSNVRIFPMITGPMFFSEETLVQVEANVAAATFAAGSIYVCVFYTVI